MDIITREPKQSKSEGTFSTPIRLNRELSLQVRQIAEMTRQPVTSVLNELVSYALDHVEVCPVGLYDMRFVERGTRK